MASPRRWPTLPAPETWRDRSVEEHARGLEAACRAAMQVLAAGPDPERRLARIDPVPASTRALLSRLARC